MPELSPVAQTWVNIVLIWVGFGSLAGMLARVILPLEEPAGSLPTLTLGITGSAIGLGLLSWIQGGPSNPITLAGFFSSVAGAFGLLLIYHFLRVVVHRQQPPAEAEEEEEGFQIGD